MVEIHQDMVHSWALVNTVINFQVITKFWRRSVLHGVKAFVKCWS